MHLHMLVQFSLEVVALWFLLCWQIEKTSNCLERWWVLSFKERHLLEQSLYSNLFLPLVCIPILVVDREIAGVFFVKRDV